MMKAISSLVLGFISLVVVLIVYILGTISVLWFFVPISLFCVFVDELLTFMGTSLKREVKCFIKWVKGKLK